jgi:hypothetical protein
MLFALAVLAMGGIQAIADARKGKRSVGDTGMQHVSSEPLLPLSVDNRRGFDGS